MRTVPRVSRQGELTRNNQVAICTSADYHRQNHRRSNSLSKVLSPDERRAKDIEGHGRRRSQLADIPLLEAQLLPSLRDTIDRMTHPPLARDRDMDDLSFANGPKHPALSRSSFSSQLGPYLLSPSNNTEGSNLQLGSAMKQKSPSFPTQPEPVWTHDSYRMPSTPHLGTYDPPTSQGSRSQSHHGPSDTRLNLKPHQLGKVTRDASQSLGMSHNFLEHDIGPPTVRLTTSMNLTELIFSDIHSLSIGPGRLPQSCPLAVLPEIGRRRPRIGLVVRRKDFISKTTLAAISHGAGFKTVAAPDTRENMFARSPLESFSTMVPMMVITLIVNLFSPDASRLLSLP